MKKILLFLYWLPVELYWDMRWFQVKVKRLKRSLRLALLERFRQLQDCMIKSCGCEDGNYAVVVFHENKYLDFQYTFSLKKAKAIYEELGLKKYEVCIENMKTNAILLMNSRRGWYFRNK